MPPRVTRNSALCRSLLFRHRVSQLPGTRWFERPFCGSGRLLGQLPVVATIEVLDNADVGGFFLMVADANLEGLVYPVLAVFDMVISAFALAHDVEGVAGVERRVSSLGV